MLNIMSLRNLSIVAVIVAVFLAGAWVNGMRWEATHNAAMKDIAERAATAQMQARAEEQRRQHSIEGIRTNAQTEIAIARTDAAAADAAAGRLRARIDKLASTAASYTGVTAGGEAAKDPILLLAEVFTEMERAGRAMAEEADARGIAGSACEKAYDAIREVN